MRLHLEQAVTGSPHPEHDQHRYVDRWGARSRSCTRGIPTNGVTVDEIRDILCGRHCLLSSSRPGRVQSRASGSPDQRGPRRRAEHRRAAMSGDTILRVAFIGIEIWAGRCSLHGPVAT
jgi:hypothetical protein